MGRATDKLAAFGHVPFRFRYREDGSPFLLLQVPTSAGLDANDLQELQALDMGGPLEVEILSDADWLQEQPRIIEDRE